MSETMIARAPWHLWAVGVLSLLWNAMGGIDYSMTMMRNETYLSAMTPEQIAWVGSFPAWANAAWAAGVWGAVLGSMLLLLRSRWAVTAFAVSLAGLAACTAYQFGMSDMPASLETASAYLFSVLLWAVAIALYVYARALWKRGHLH